MKYHLHLDLEGLNGRGNPCDDVLQNHFFFILVPVYQGFEFMHLQIIEILDSESFSNNSKYKESTKASKQGAFLQKDQREGFFYVSESLFLGSFHGK